MNPTSVPAAPRTATLRWLVRVRVLLTGAALLTILLARYGFDLALPLPPLLAVIAALAIFNAGTALRLRRPTEPRAWELFLQLLADLTALAALLFFSGGWANPFVFLFLLPLAIGAAAIPGRYTLAILLIAVGCYTGLTVSSLGDGGGHHSPSFDLHLWGMWACFVISALLITLFIGHSSRALRDRERELAAARERALRDEHVVALGALAAGTAHELGTPLGTMAILLGDLRRRHAEGELGQDLGLLHSQVYRCKDILGSLARAAGQPRAEGGGAVPVGDYLRRLLADWRPQGGLMLTIELKAGPGPAIVVDQTLSQALLNVLNNAAEASPEEVSVQADWTDEHLDLAVLDRGPGLPEHQRARLGKQPVEDGHGLGVGLYLTAATLSRLGGQLHLETREGGGTRVRIELPLTRLRVAPA